MTSLSLDPVAVHQDIAFGGRGRADRRGPFAMRVARVFIVVLLAGAALLVLGNTVGPRVFGYKTYYVRSGSMKPKIPVGALALYRPVAAAKLKVGDVIAFSRPGHNGDTVSHRIVRIEPGPTGGLVTKGDANGAPDDWRVPVKGDGWRYSAHVPVVGYAVGAVGTPQGKFIALTIVGLSLVALALLGIWRSKPSDTSVLSPTVPFRSLRESAGLVVPAAPSLDPESPPQARMAPEPLKTAVVLSIVPDAPATAGSDLHDYLTIISCNTRVLLRSTPDGDERRTGLAAIADASRCALRVLEDPETTELLVGDGSR